MPKFHDGPKVYVVGLTKLSERGLRKFLDDAGVDADKYVSMDVSGAEEIVRLGGKICYRSFQEGMNPNLTKVRKEAGEYIASILSQAHGSVLEHASITFVFHDVSRVFTHELCRHRAGTAISQESMRFVRLDDMRFWVPQCFTVLHGEELDETAKEIVEETVRYLESQQRRLRDVLDVDSMSFEDKKKITSAMRRVAPDGVSTTIMWTANVRALRHVILMRTAAGAEEEIRRVFDLVAIACKQNMPLLFSDFERGADGVWTCKNKLQPYEGGR